MICLYDKNETNFSTNGLCVLSPITCVVGETAGGSYELRMEHPIDDAGAFALLQEDMIIKAPVPPRYIPAITLPEVKILQTTGAADVFSVLPVWKPEEIDPTIQNIRRLYEDYIWNPGRAYNAGAMVVYYSNIYRALVYNFAVTPTSTSSVWAYVAPLQADSGGGSYTPGTIIETLAGGVTVFKLADYNGQYMRIRTLSGTVGYILRNKCEETQQSQSGQVIPARTITEQLFRIYRVEGTDTENSIIIDARHISYDYAGNSTLDCKLYGADPMTAISIMQGSLLNEDDRNIYCNITGKEVTQDWSYKNPINVLLDPESGLLGILGGALIRDNDEFFILDNSSPRQGITIEYGVNMTGVKWTRNIENVVTRVVPRANAGVDSFIYLDDLYVDSPAINDYAFPRTEVLNCAYTVGEEHEKPDGTKEKWTEETIRTQILKDAQARFSRDHVDGPDISLDVNFLLLGDTEEFRQYRGLQSVCLYDEITVKTGRSGVTAKAQVNEYEYDSILRRYNMIRVGDISRFSQRVPGYRVMRNSITYDKLSVDLINRIRSANASGSTNSYSPGTDPGGGAVTGTDIIDNLNSTDVTAALSANQGRILSERIPGTYKLDSLIWGNSTAAKTYTFTNNDIFLMFIARRNTAHDEYSGLYIGSAANNNSHIKEIAGSEAVALSISGLTLTITPSQPYMSASIAILHNA